MPGTYLYACLLRARPPVQHVALRAFPDTSWYTITLFDIAWSHQTASQYVIVTFVRWVTELQQSESRSCSSYRNWSRGILCEKSRGWVRGGLWYSTSSMRSCYDEQWVERWPTCSLHPSPCVRLPLYNQQTTPCGCTAAHVAHACPLTKDSRRISGYHMQPPTIHMHPFKILTVRTVPTAVYLVLHVHSMYLVLTHINSILRLPFKPTRLETHGNPRDSSIASLMVMNR